MQNLNLFELPHHFRFPCLARWPVQVLYSPTHGTVYVDNSIEQRYDLLTSLLLSPKPGQTIPPWSRRIDTVAPEEFDTPDPTCFPDDILTYITTTHDEAIIVYLADLETHVTPDIKTACPGIMDLLASDLAQIGRAHV